MRTIDIIATRRVILNSSNPISSPIYNVMCTKIITQKTWIGTYKWQCTKPEYQDGLCKRHYKRKIAKSTLYVNREGYREPTTEEMKSGKTLYLKNHGPYGGHRYIKGIICIENFSRQTTIPPDPKLFVIKSI